MTFCVLDTETTGLDASTEFIVEIGWTIVDNKGSVLKTIENYLCYYDKDIDPEASAVHHITKEMLVNAPKISNVLRMLEDDCEKFSVRALVAHNLSFDGPFIHNTIKREKLSLPFLENTEGICTLRLARKLFPNAPSHNLQVLRYFLKLPNIPDTIIPHRAEADVFVLKELFKFIINKINKESFEEFLAYCDEPFLVAIMPFGKYKGKKIVDIERSYLTWLLNLKELDADMRYTIRFHLGMEK